MQSDAGQERELSHGPESGCSVLGIGVGLLALIGILALLARPMGESLDGADLVAEWMPTGAPAGFRVASANRLPTREVMLVLERQGDADLSGPEELILVRYPSNGQAEAKMRGSSAPQSADSSGRGGEHEDPAQELERWQRERDFNLHLTVDRGEIVWGAWRAASATERSLRDDGTWRESIRVNLSQPDRYLLLFAQWPPNESADPEALKPILARIAMQAM